MSGLSLPERIVHAAERAIVEASAAKHETALRGVESVEGFPHDFAKAALMAGLDAEAAALQKLGLYGPAYDRRELARRIGDVPASKAV